MTSVKYFVNWIREAGRGHICASVTWGVFLIYGITMLTRQSLDASFTIWGTGSRELMFICEITGSFLGFSEFYYLLQQKKQDLYFSLPVSKCVVFWSRYVHGLLSFFPPVILILLICGIYEGASAEAYLNDFAGYAGRSILAAAGVFLIFYHISILCVVFCGNIISALLSFGMILLCGRFFLYNVCEAAAKEYFRTYYRIPVIDSAAGLLSPADLSEYLLGGMIFEKQKALVYVPDRMYIAAAAGWIIVFLVIFSLAIRRRKPERTGKIFVSSAAERTAEGVLCFLGSTWLAVFLVSISGIRGKSRAGAAGITILSCIAAAFFIHCMAEWFFHDRSRKIFRTKKQLFAEISAAVFAAAAFPAGADIYDRYFPAEDKVVSIGVSIDGLNMDGQMYRDAAFGTDTYKTDSQLDQFRMSGDGKEAVLSWIMSAALTGGTEKENIYTHATVCYYLKGGTRKYRTYAVNRSDFEAFADVFNTDEYKNALYPVPKTDKTSRMRFSWNDGVKQNAMKLTADEKKILIQEYMSDRSQMKMKNLSCTLPCGLLIVESGEYDINYELPVYPFLKRTCAFLEKKGIHTDYGINDYTVLSVEMYDQYKISSENASGGTIWQYYDTPEEIAVWQPRLIPQVFDMQPLLCPVDYKSVKAVVEDSDTNSTMEIRCVLRTENFEYTNDAAGEEK